ncbi:MAG: TIM barrel protein [Armatimonadetes bacterium]|nr:TIM barrel protein [Armatimonadota bacterium]
MRLSACVEMLFRERPFLERLESVQAAGLTAFEFWDYRPHDLAALADKKNALGLDVAAFVGTPGVGFVDPAQRGLLVDTCGAACEAARQLDCPTLIVTTGNEREGVARSEQHESIVAGLQVLAPVVEAAGVTLALEPLNILVDHRGYYLWSADEGFEILREVGSANVKLLFDIYHEQVQCGNVLQRMERDLDRIGHVHLADVPGRMEPGTGELNYAVILPRLKEMGYTGFAGLECRPSTSDHPSIVRAVGALLP